MTARSARGPRTVLTARGDRTARTASGRAAQAVRARGAVRRTRGALLAVPLLALALAGCGIRPTEVPTDFGAAPSRLPCALTGTGVATQSSAGIPVQVFLLCSSQLVAVDRTVRTAAGDAATERVRAAQALLDDLASPPTAAERQAGYTTDVRRGVKVSGPRPGDPEGALRLDVPPADLTPYALAQVVCTLAGSTDDSDDGTAVLGGPGDEAPLRYGCTPEVRSRPGTEAPPTTAADGS